jgi:hypothetical protein
MKTGMLLDADARRTLDLRQRAVDYYRQKYGAMPDLSGEHPLSPRKRSMLAPSRYNAPEPCCPTT